MPARLVPLMRTLLKWDVLFVMEHDDLRRATDGAHFRLARQLRRTLVTLDRDYLDDRRFPAAESGGVLVLSAPREDGLLRILARVDRELLRGAGDAEPASLPLAGAQAAPARGLARASGANGVIAIAGGDVVVADRIVTGGTVLVDGERIAVIERRFADGSRRRHARSTPAAATWCPASSTSTCTASQGLDVLDDGAPVAAARVACCPHSASRRSARPAWPARPKRWRRS